MGAGGFGGAGGYVPPGQYGNFPLPPDPIELNTAALNRLALAIERIENPRLVANTEAQESIGNLESRLVTVEKAQREAVVLLELWATGYYSAAQVENTKAWLERWK